MNRIKASMVLGLVMLIGLAACQPAKERLAQHKKHHSAEEWTLHSYRFHPANDDGTWVYYYMLSDPYACSSCNNSSSTRPDPSRSASLYYYRSTTPVTDFRSVPFTRATSGAPKEMQDELKSAKDLEEEEKELPAEEEPQSVGEQEAAANDESFGPESEASATEGTAATESGDSNTASETPAAESSSDSGASGGDSGGGDSGGSD